MPERFFIPSSMIELPNWILWRKEESKGRTTKIPYYVKEDRSPEGYSVYHASSTNPDTWRNYHKVFGFLLVHKGEFSGIGFVITLESGLIFIDIDDCIDDEGILDDRAQDILSTLKDTAFCEISQSGHGLHLFVKGKIPRSFKNPLNGVEMYAEKRYCAITGNALLLNEPEEDQEALSLLFEKYKTPDRVKSEAVHSPVEHSLSVSDTQLLEMAKRNPKFLALWNGDHSGYSSQSEADLSLCGKLAFWCDRDIGRMDALFRMSGLCRAKWTDREDYRNNTLDIACAKCHESFSEYVQRKHKEEGDQLEKCLFFW